MENVKKNRIAAVYTRVSTKEQAEEGYSIDEQEKLLTAYCAQNQIGIYKVYSDKGISGKTMKQRPGVTALMVDAELKKFDMVLVWKLSRISRSQKDTLNIIEKLNYNNVEFKSLTENLETLTAMGKLHFSIMSGFAEFERNQIAENVKMGMKARAREGKWNGGHILGYDLVDDPNSTRKRGEKMLVINEKEAETIRYIFDLYYGGNGFKAIANRLNKEGHRTKKGNFFSMATLGETLTNPVYCGIIRYDLRQDWTTKRRRGINANPILVKGKHEGIVSKEVFDRVQELRKTKAGKPGRSYDGSFPFTGLLRCPECHSGMVASRVIAKRKDGTRHVTRYYYCGAFKNKGTAVCHSNGVRADDAEKYIYKKLERLFSSDALLKEILSKVNLQRRNRIEPAEIKIEEIDKDLKALEKNREQYFSLMESGGIDNDILITKLKEIGCKVSELEEQKVQQKSYQAFSEVIEVPFDLVKATLSELGKLLDTTSSHSEQKTLLHLLIDEIVVGSDRRPETMKIKFNKVLIDYILKNGGLPTEGNPLSLYSNLVGYGVYDFGAGV